MAGSAITVEVRGMEEVERALGELARRGRHLRPAMDEVGSYLVSSTQLRFERQRDPDGKAWAPTIRGGNILRQSSRLMQSLTHRAGDDQVEAGTNVRYAAIHQFGGTIRAKNAPYLQFRLPGGRYARKSQVTIPARPYLGVSDADGSEIVGIVEDHLAEGLR